LTYTVNAIGNSFAEPFFSKKGADFVRRHVQSDGQDAYLDPADKTLYVLTRWDESGNAWACYRKGEPVEPWNNACHVGPYGGWTPALAGFGTTFGYRFCKSREKTPSFYVTGFVTNPGTNPLNQYPNTYPSTQTDFWVVVYRFQAQRLGTTDGVAFRDFTNTEGWAGSSCKGGDNRVPRCYLVVDTYSTNACAPEEAVPTGVAADGRSLYVCLPKGNGGKGSVKKYDLSDLGAAPVTWNITNPGQIIVDRGGKPWVIRYGPYGPDCSANIHQLDPAAPSGAGKVLKTLALPGSVKAYGLWYDGSTYLVVTDLNGPIRAYNLASLPAGNPTPTAYTWGDSVFHNKPVGAVADGYWSWPVKAIVDGTIGRPGCTLHVVENVPGSLVLSSYALKAPDGGLGPRKYRTAGLAFANCAVADPDDTTKFYTGNHAMTVTIGAGTDNTCTWRHAGVTADFCKYKDDPRLYGLGGTGGWWRTFAGQKFFFSPSRAMTPGGHAVAIYKVDSGYRLKPCGLVTFGDPSHGKCSRALNPWAVDHWPTTYPRAVGDGASNWGIWTNKAGDGTIHAGEWESTPHQTPGWFIYVDQHCHIWFAGDQSGVVELTPDPRLDRSNNLRYHWQGKVRGTNTPYYRLWPLPATDGGGANAFTMIKAFCYDSANDVGVALGFDSGPGGDCNLEPAASWQPTGRVLARWEHFKGRGGKKRSLAFVKRGTSTKSDLIWGPARLPELPYLNGTFDCPIALDIDDDGYTYVGNFLHDITLFDRTGRKVGGGPGVPSLVLGLEIPGAAGAPHMSSGGEAIDLRNGLRVSKVTSPHGKRVVTCEGEKGQRVLATVIGTLP
jgi:hypothetical protein